MYFPYPLLVIIATISAAQSEVDVWALFHATPPTITGQTPVSSAVSNEIPDFTPFRGPRHDEFDWALTKVSNIRYENIFILWLK